MNTRIHPAILIGIGSFILYLATLSRFPFPGASEQLIVLHSGINDFSPSTHFIWNRLVRLILLFPGAITLKLNILSAVFGSLCVSMTYILASQLQFKAKSRRVSEYRLSVVTACAASIFLALCPSFWFASSRAHMATFDLFLLLCAGYGLHRFRTTSQSLWLFVFAFIYGVGMVEYPLFIILAPITAIYLGLLIFIRKRKISRHYFPGLLLFGLIGFSTYIPAAYLYSQSPTYEWLGLSTQFDLHLHLWAHHMLQIFGFIPRLGWIIYILLSLAPLGLAHFTARNRDLFRGDTAINATKFLLITGLGLTIYMAPYFLDFKLLGLSYIIVPYFFIALAMGYAAAYFYAIFCEDHAMKGRKKPHPGSFMLKLIGILTVLTTISTLPINYTLIQTRAGRLLYQWAEETIRSMGDCTWLISRGKLGNQLLIAAHEQEHPLTYIDGPAVRSPSFKHFMASRLTSDRLKGLAQIGLTPLLKEWMGKGENVGHEIAFFDIPTAWEQTGFHVIPNKTLYLGHKDNTKTNQIEWIQTNLDYWEGLIEPLEKMRNSKHMLSESADYQSAHLSRVANQSGVMMEKIRQFQIAERAYDTSIRLYPDNLFAKLNMYMLLLKQDLRESDQINLLAEVKDLLNLRENKLPYQALMLRNGALENPETLQFVLQLEAMPAFDPRAKVGLSDVYNHILKKEWAEARKWLDLLVEENPTYSEAWIMLGYTAHRQGDIETFNRCIKQMERLEENWVPLLFIQAKIAKENNELALHKVYLKRVIEESPENLMALLSQLGMALGEGDLPLIKKYAQKVLFIHPENALGNFAMGYQKLMLEENELAESFLQRSVEGNNVPPLAYNNYAWALHLNGKFKEALYYAEESLNRETPTGHTWHTHAVIHMDLNQLAKAAPSLVKAVEMEPTEIQILNTVVTWLARSGYEQEASSLKEKLIDLKDVALTAKEIDHFKKVAKSVE